jgi:hypothetical protein
VLKFVNQVPVTIKVSAEYIQVMTVRKQEIVYGLTAVINDVCHIGDIEDIAYAQKGRGTDPFEFSYTCTREHALMIFNSPKRDAIINVSMINCKV